MPACALRAERRRSFEDFLGVGGATYAHSGCNSKGVRRRRCKASSNEGDCNFIGVWNPLPEQLTAIRLPPRGLALPTSFEAHDVSEPYVDPGGLTFKNFCLLSVTAAVAGGVGFVAARAQLAPPGAGEGVPTPATDIEGTAAASSSAPPAPEAATAATPSAAAAGAGARRTTTRRPARALTPEELARDQRIAELQVQRDIADERRREVLSRRDELDLELQPSLDEVEMQLKELGAKIAAEESGVCLETSVADQEVIDKARDADKQARSAISNVYEQVVPMVLQGQRVQNILDQRLTTIRERIPHIINEEVKAGFGDLTQQLEGQIPGISTFAFWDDMPALSLMIAGLAAPSQLNWLHGENNTRLVVSIVLLVLDSVALGTGLHMKCITWIMGSRGSFLKPWLSVDILSLMFTITVRYLARKQIMKTYEQMDTFAEEPLDLPIDEPAIAFRMQLERQLMLGAQAMLQYDRLAHSGAFKLLDILPAFDFVWQFGGIALLFDTPGQFCNAQLLMQWTRVRGIIFLVGLLPVVISLGLVALKAAVASQGFCMAVLKAAADADKQYFPTGPPVVTLLVRAFLVRDTTDMQSMELNIIDFEKKIAQNERDRLKAEYEAADQDVKYKEERFHTHSEKMGRKTQEEEFMQQYQQSMRRVVGASDEAEHSASVAAAGLGEMQGQAASQFTMLAAEATTDLAAAEIVATAGLAELAAMAPAAPPSFTNLAGGMFESLGVDGDGGTGEAPEGALGETGAPPSGSGS